MKTPPITSHKVCQKHHSKRTIWKTPLKTSSIINECALFPAKTSGHDVFAGVSVKNIFSCDVYGGILTIIGAAALITPLKTSLHDVNGLLSLALSEAVMFLAHFQEV
jgi:hypothetical protein